MGSHFCKGFWKFRWNAFLPKFPKAVGLKDFQYLYLKLQIWKRGQNSEFENDSLGLRLFLQISLPWQTHKDIRGGFAWHGPGRAWPPSHHPTLKSNLLKTTPQIYGGFRDFFWKVCIFCLHYLIGKRKLICQLFLSIGWINHHQQPHSLDQKKTNQPTNQTKNICIEFLREGGCSRRGGVTGEP